MSQMNPPVPDFICAILASSVSSCVMEDRDIEFSIVSGSSEEMLFGCLDSLAATMKGVPLSWTLVVTVNNPGTGLAGRVRARYPEARIIENAEPRGFAANHNA